MKTCTDYTVVTSGTTAFVDGGWYVVQGEPDSMFYHSAIAVSGSAHLILCDEGHLPVNGIRVTEGNALTIYGQRRGTGQLDTEGSEYCAGIGGGRDESCGTITINGGIVKAQGGGSWNGATALGTDGGAGIGSGASSDSTPENGGKVVINGGRVYATGGHSAAGIGGGEKCAGAEVVINGGRVVSMRGHRNNADSYFIGGIGAGYGCSSHGTLKVAEDIAVRGSNVSDYWFSMADMAQGAEGAVTAGGYKYYSTRKTVPEQRLASVKYLDEHGVEQVCAEAVVVTKDTYLLEDGKWYVVPQDADVVCLETLLVNGDVNLILGDGSQLEVIAEDYYSGIYVGKQKSLAIYAQARKTGELIAQTREYYYGIGGWEDGACGTITINGGTVTAIGGRDGAGIGGTVTINDGVVTATNYDSAGIDGTVLINGGTVTASGGGEGAGIGGTVTINNGVVTATGGYDGAGIGGTVTINDGVVTATGGYDGAGIGGGDYGDGGTVVINAGTVTATGGYYGAGIGGGRCGNGGSVTIGGGIVIASGKYYGAGIGAGDDREDHGSLKVTADLEVYAGKTWAKDPKARGSDGTVALGGERCYVIGTVPEAPTYTIRFNGNEATGGEMAPQLMVFDSEAALAPNQFTRTGYQFFGWATQTYYSPDYTNCQTVVNLTSEIGGTFDLYAKWSLNRCEIVFDANGGSGYMEGFSFYYGDQRWLQGNSFSYPNHKFLGWAREPDGEVVFENYAEVSGLAAEVDGTVALYAQWKSLLDSVRIGDACVFDLEKDLGVEIDADYAAGDKVTVKLETLPKGLKLVTTQYKESTGKKAVTNVVYTIEGVPTETLDYNAAPMFARITVTKKVGTKTVKTETLQRVRLEVEAAIPKKLTGVLNADITPVNAAELWPEIDAKWSFKGWPAGIKFTAKALAATKTAPAYSAFSIYGKPTKAGVFTVTATTPAKEQKFITFTVWPSEDEKSFRYTTRAYTAVLKNLGDQVTGASGLPTGLKFTASAVAATKTSPAYAAGDVYGTPTKAGVYAVQLTKKDPSDPTGRKTLKEKETILWNITDGANPGLGSENIYWASANAKFDSVQAMVTVMQGALFEFYVDVGALESSAKVTVTGLPSGLQYDAKTCKITGVATKVESKVVVVKVVQNGVTVTKRFAFDVRPNLVAGTYHTYFIMYNRGRGCHAATAVLTPAAGGTAKLVFDEYVPSKGKMVKYTVSSAKGFTMSSTYDPEYGNRANVHYDFLLKADARNNPDFAGMERLIRFEVTAQYHAGEDYSRATGTATLVESGVATKVVDSSNYYYGVVAKVITPAELLRLGGASFKLPMYTENIAEVSTLEEQTITNHWGYFTTTFDAKKAQYQVVGKLRDGTAVKAMSPMTYLEEAIPGAPFVIAEKGGAKRTFIGIAGYGLQSISGGSVAVWSNDGLFPVACESSQLETPPATAAEQIGEGGGTLALDVDEWSKSGFEDDAPRFTMVVNGADLAKAKLDVYAPNAAEGAKPLASIASAKLAANSGYVFKGSFKWDAKVGGDGNTYAFELVPVASEDLRFAGRCEVKPAKGAAVVLTARVVSADEDCVQLWENGPYWATCNVGATKPEESGYYFWWGDTVGYRPEGGTWDDVLSWYPDVTWVSSTGTVMSESPFDSDTCPSNGDESTLRSLGYIDSTGNLVAAHDAATVHLGAPWRMPTDAEWEALMDNCDTTWTNRNGVCGWLVTGRGAFSAKSVFLPAAGVGFDSTLDCPDSHGEYWSSTPSYWDGLYRAWCLRFYPGDFYRSERFRYYGHSVRPVRGFAE